MTIFKGKPTYMPPLITHLDLVEAQRKNAKCRKIVELLFQNHAAVKHTYTIQNCLLYKLHKGKLLTYIPPEFSTKLFKILHDSPHGGHSYFVKVYQQYKEHYYTPKLMKLLKTYLDGCLKCQQFNTSHKGPVGEFTNIHPPIGQWTVNRRIYIDYMGPFTKTGRQNRYICHIMDHCTRFAMAIPTRKATAKCAIALLEKWVNLFGPPEEIFSDSGSHFIADLFQEYVQTCKATALFSPTYTAHPNLVERVNQTLIHSLRNYVNEYHNNWDDFVESCTAGYNKRYQDSLQTSPHEVVFGYKPRIPQFTDTTKPIYKKAKTHFKNLDTIRSEAKRNLERAIKRSTDHENKKRRPPPILYPGETVLLLRPRQPKPHETKKFLKHYTKPHIIVSRLSDLMYTVVPLKNPKAIPQKAHITKLKKYFPRRVNVIKTVSPGSGKPIHFIPEKNVVRDFCTHSIFTVIKYIIGEFYSTIGDNLSQFRFRVPYELVKQCEYLWNVTKKNNCGKNPIYLSMARHHH